MAAHEPDDPLEQMLDALEAEAETWREETLVDALRWNIRARQALSRKNRMMQQRLNEIEQKLEGQ